MAWRNLVDVRQSYPDTDAVKVRSGRTVLIFNIRRNDYRLIAAAHFNRQIVYVDALYDARGIQQRPLERNIMKTTQTKIEFARLPKDYTGLCRMLTPRPIHDKVDFENVTEITDAMAGHKLTADQEDYFDLLCRLIEDYDKEHAQLDTPKVTALDALQHLLDANDMSAADLARLLDVHRTLGAMILRGERQLTLAHVRTLAKRFCVSADLFLP